MTHTVTVTDSRTPPAANTLLTRWPLGGFVAFNGPSGDGERRRAIVVDHDVAAGSVVLQDGADRVTLGATELADAVLVARSADEYARRVQTRGRALGREYGHERVATETLALLDRPRDVEAAPVRARVVTATEYVLRPRAAVTDVERALRESLRVERTYFGGSLFARETEPTTEVTVTLLDPTGAGSTETASTDAAEEGR